MIKTVQVEERRVICDICNKNHYTMHGPTDKARDKWIHASDFSATGRDLDICPNCVTFLRNLLSGKTDGEC